MSDLNRDLDPDFENDANIVADLSDLDPHNAVDLLDDLDPDRSRPVSVLQPNILTVTLSFPLTLMATLTQKGHGGAVTS